MSAELTLILAAIAFFVAYWIAKMIPGWGK